MSARILIYMALVNLLAADFMNPEMQSNGRLQVGANIDGINRNNAQLDFIPSCENLIGNNLIEQ